MRPAAMGSVSLMEPRRLMVTVALDHCWKLELTLPMIEPNWTMSAVCIILIPVGFRL